MAKWLKGGSPLGRKGLVGFGFTITGFTRAEEGVERDLEGFRLWLVRECDIFSIYNLYYIYFIFIFIFTKI